MRREKEDERMSNEYAKSQREGSEILGGDEVRARRCKR